MPRDPRKVEKHPALPDYLHNSSQITKLINKVMKKGKKTLAENLVHKALKDVAEKTKEDPVLVLGRAVKNITPVIEVKARRIGGATYQVPIEVRGNRKLHLAISWLIEGARARKGASFDIRLAQEILDASNSVGLAIKKKEDVHKMAEANKALAHLSRH